MPEKRKGEVPLRNLGGRQILQLRFLGKGGSCLLLSMGSEIKRFKEIR